jgi:two-component system cell cycle response regulator DivK
LTTSIVKENRIVFTILYVEDNLDNKLLVQKVLEAKGYRFLWAPNGQKGLDMALAETPHVILLDINLPDIDGYEVARCLRSREAGGTGRVPIIAITANALKGDAEKALAAGCDMYVAKPINIRELWSRVQACLPATPE